MSIIDCLHLGCPTVNVFRPFDPHLNESSKGYDGQYVYMATYDPLLINRNFIFLFDHPAYRYQRMLYPLLAHVLAMGQPRAYPYALFFLNIAAYLSGAWVVWRLSEIERWTSWIVLGYLSISGLLYTTFGTLPESLALTLSLMGILFWKRQQQTLALICFAASTLAKENFIVIGFSLLLWESFKKKISVSRLLSQVAAISFPFLAWYGYVQFRLPTESTFSEIHQGPHSFGIGRLSLPFVGMWQETWYGVMHLTTRSNIKLTASISLVTTLCAVLCFYGFVRRPSFWGFLAVTQILFASALRGDLWNYHAGSVRLVIPAFFFAMVWCVDEIHFLSTLDDLGSTPPG